MIRARTRDRGSASMWVVAACALLLTISAVVTLRTTAVLVRHRAEAAADLAALAAAGRIGVGGSPCAAAAHVAVANGATVTSCRAELDAGARSGTVTVVVNLTAMIPVVGRQTVRASARAGRLPGGS